MLAWLAADVTEHPSSHREQQLLLVRSTITLTHDPRSHDSKWQSTILSSPSVQCLEVEADVKFVVGSTTLVTLSGAVRYQQK